jgi:hypothetical protein
MNFDYTYIAILGFPVFEPMILLTNLVLFILSIIFFQTLASYSVKYGKQMGAFILLLGVSSLFGAIAHAIHYQLGRLFFNAVFFLMNASSLFSVYYCFRAAIDYTGREGRNRKPYYFAVMAWIIIMLSVCLIFKDFLLIKIHAGLVLIYSLIAHLWAKRNKNEKGNGLVTLGFLLSFLPILVHSLKISVNEWFNYKDISHVIMIVSLSIIYLGAKKNAEDLQYQTSPKD